MSGTRPPEAPPPPRSGESHDAGQSVQWTDTNKFIVMLAVAVALLALIVTLGWVVYYRLVG